MIICSVMCRLAAVSVRRVETPLTALLTPGDDASDRRRRGHLGTRPPVEVSVHSFITGSSCHTFLQSGLVVVELYE